MINSGNLKSGIGPWRKVKKARFVGLEYALDLARIQGTFPFLREDEDDRYYKLLK